MVGSNFSITPIRNGFDTTTISFSFRKVNNKKGYDIMNEFAKMIYEQWRRCNEDRDLYFKKGEELNEELESILSSNLSDKIYDTFCKSCLEIEESAFIAGFGYACKCLSNGKIELGGGK